MRILKTDIAQRRWKIFRSRPTAFWSGIILGIACIFSFTAELWSNNKPIFMSYNGSWYFPVLKDYHPSIFGIESSLETDYKELDIDDKGWALWPVNRWNPYERYKDVEIYPSKPTTWNLMGVDTAGRDVFARILYGLRYSITFAMLVWVASLALGIVAGGMMGYAGSWIDLIGQRIVEIYSTIPFLFVVLILVSIFGASLKLLVIIVALFQWIFFSDYVRAEFLKLRRQNFVEVGRALGASHSRLIFRHILPNSLIPVITFSPFIIASNINSLAALDYLGFGLPPPTPSWGELLQQGKENFLNAWWLAVYPSIALFFSLVLMSLVGDGVRVAFDPKSTAK